MPLRLVGGGGRGGKRGLDRHSSFPVLFEKCLVLFLVLGVWCWWQRRLVGRDRAKWLELLFTCTPPKNLPRIMR